MENKQPSEDMGIAFVLIRELSKANRRLFIVCLLLAAFCAYREWVFQSYDYVDASLSTSGGGDAIVNVGLQEAESGENILKD